MSTTMISADFPGEWLDPSLPRLYTRLGYIYIYSPIPHNQLRPTRIIRYEAYIRLIKTTYSGIFVYPLRRSFIDKLINLYKNNI